MKTRTQGNEEYMEGTNTQGMLEKIQEYPEEKNKQTKT